MPRKKEKARRSKDTRKKDIKLAEPKIIYIKDDGMSPGRIVAAAEFVRMTF